MINYICLHFSSARNKIIGLEGKKIDEEKKCYQSLPSGLVHVTYDKRETMNFMFLCFFTYLQ
jgi:hypothetical protein